MSMADYCLPHYPVLVCTVRHKLCHLGLVWHQVVPQPPNLALTSILGMHFPMDGRHLQQQNGRAHTDRIGPTKRHTKN